MRGEVQWALHDPATATVSLLRALEISRAQRAVSFEIRSVVSLLTLIPGLTGREAQLMKLKAALEGLQSREGGRDESAALGLLAHS